MPRFSELDEEFVCPHRNGCPYLEGLPAKWVWDRYAQSSGLECQYEYQIEQLNKQLTDSGRQNRELELQNQHLKAQVRALHQRQFKGAQHPGRDFRFRVLLDPTQETWRSGRPSALAAAQTKGH
jgi:hypothetical protein